MLSAFAAVWISAQGKKPAFADVPRYEIEARFERGNRAARIVSKVFLPLQAQSDGVPFLLSGIATDVKVSVGTGAVEANIVRKRGENNVWILTPRAPGGLNGAITVEYTLNGSDGFVRSLGPEVSFANGSIAAWYPEFDTGSSVGYVGSISTTVPNGDECVATGVLVSTKVSGGFTTRIYRVDKPAMFSYASAPYRSFVLGHKIPKVSVHRIGPSVPDRRFLQTTSYIAEYFQDRFGPLPTPDLKIVESTGAGYFGASSPGIVFLQQSFLDGKYDIQTIAHEIAHQWWGGLIGEAERTEGSYLISEGLAQYSALRVVEAIDGPEKATKYRRWGYPTNGDYSVKTVSGQTQPVQSLLGMLGLIEQGTDSNLLKLDGVQAGHTIAVSKGAMTLYGMARTFGFERFDRALKKVCVQNAYRKVGWSTFESALASEGISKDVSRSWLEHSGAFGIKVYWKQIGDKLRLVKVPDLPLGLGKLEILVEGKSWVRRTISAEGGQEDLELPAGFTAKTVTVDPDCILPLNQTVQQDG